MAAQQVGCSRPRPCPCRQQKVFASLAAGRLSVLDRLRQGTHPNCSSRRASATGTSGRSNLAGFALFLPALRAMRSASTSEHVSLLCLAGAWCSQASPSTALSRYPGTAGSYIACMPLGTPSADRGMSGDEVTHLGLEQRHQGPHLLLLLLPLLLPLLLLLLLLLMMLLLVRCVLACAEQKLLGQRRSPAE